VQRVQSQSQSYFTTGGLLPISSSWHRAPWDSRPEFISPHFNTCGHSPYITSSLTRGWVCHLQLLLALASAFILGSESRGTREHILLSQIRDFPFCRLLRLAELRWKYSTQPPQGKAFISQSQSYFTTGGLPPVSSSIIIWQNYAGNKQKSYKIMIMKCSQHWTRRSPTWKMYKRLKLGGSQAYHRSSD
jgi:hypothetical protein